MKEFTKTAFEVLLTYTCAWQSMSVGRWLNDGYI